MRLEIYADRIQEELVLAAVADGIRARENRRFEFPASASASGTADLDCTRFHATEAVLSFTDAPELELVPMTTRPPENGDGAGDSSRQVDPAVGDDVQAKLLRAIKYGHDTVFAKGALLSGHVTQLHRDAGVYHLGISFIGLSSEEGRADVGGRRNSQFVVTAAAIAACRSNLHFKRKASQSQNRLSHRSTQPVATIR